MAGIEEAFQFVKYQHISHEQHISQIIIDILTLVCVWGQFYTQEPLLITTACADVTAT